MSVCLAMTARSLPESINLKSLLGRAPTPLDFVLPGFVRGTVGALVSPGGVGKSYWSLAAAVAIGAGSKADLTGLKPAEGRVVLLSKEDPLPVLEQRLHEMAKVLPKSVSYAGVDYRSCLGLDIDIMNAGWFDAIVTAARGARLVILDTLTRFHKLDENSAQDMGALLSQLESLAAASGASVLFLHHTSKAAVVNGQASLQQAARGSSVLVDNARWSAFLAVMTEQEAKSIGVPAGERVQYVRWNISKQNYGPAIPDVWYRRNDGGVLVPVKFTPMRAAPAAEQPSVPVESKAGTPVPAVTEKHGSPSAKGAFDGNW
ncbi:helicase RepA family protein [Burkholderia multivorans]|uniref:helicase RepA family protein n=1 Tax=Burkholderia multivorans TaxID=87883 RepID=UPI001C23E36A|nr:helicase RepA family protein [Burkholderia multivorans]MBU9199990.1 helicase RepA family protein [Burkholderia multivorans]